MIRLNFLLILVLCFLVSGCLIYGEGHSVGYVTTVEDGFFWDTVWIRADVASSQTNGYAVRKGYASIQLKEQLLRSAENHQKVEIYFKKHLGMARLGDDTLSDEIVNFKLVNEPVIDK